MRWVVAATLLVSRIAAADELTGDWGGLREDLAKHGVTVTASYAPEAFTAADYEGLIGGLGQIGIDVDVGPKLHVVGLAIHGNDLSIQLMDVHGVSSNTAPQDVRLFEAWAEYGVGAFTLRAGLLSADTELIIATQATTLLSGTFGMFAPMTINVGGPQYAIATPGLSARFEADDVVVRAAVYDGELENKHGIPTGLSEALAITEVALANVIKLGGWHHTARGNGYYAIVDGVLTTQLGAFARIAVAPHEPLPFYVDTGFRFRRASVGMAFSHTETGPQTLVEATYQVDVRGWLTLHPDIQLHLLREDEAVVVGTRAVITL